MRRDPNRSPASVRASHGVARGILGGAKENCSYLGQLPDEPIAITRSSLNFSLWGGVHSTWLGFSQFWEEHQASGALEAQSDQGCVVQREGSASEPRQETTALLMVLKRKLSSKDFPLVCSKLQSFILPGPLCSRLQKGFRKELASILNISDRFFQGSLFGRIRPSKVFRGLEARSPAEVRRVRGVEIEDFTVHDPARGILVTQKDMYPKRGFPFGFGVGSKAYASKCTCPYAAALQDGICLNRCRGHIAQHLSEIWTRVSGGRAAGLSLFAGGGREYRQRGGREQQWTLPALMSRLSHGRVWLLSPKAGVQRSPQRRLSGAVECSPARGRWGMRCSFS